MHVHRLISSLGCFRKCLLSVTILLVAVASRGVAPVDAQVPDTLFHDTFESGEFDTSRWTARPASDGGVVEVVSQIQGLADIGHSGAFAVAMGRSSDGSLAVNDLDLSLDLSGQSDVALSFYIRNNDEDASPLDGIWMSDDGGTTFERVYALTFGWNNTWGQMPALDVDQLARDNGLSLTSTFVIRFRQTDNDDFLGSSAFTRDGFFLDDVTVYVPGTTYATIPFSDTFERADLGPHWTRSNPTQTAGPATVRPLSRAEIVTDVQGSIGVAYEGVRALAIGRYTDGNLTTSSADLHLDLSGHTDVELSFWIRDVSDETDEFDGIFFSDDGGDTFVRVFSFDPNGWTNGWGRFPPIDLDHLAEVHGLALTNRFVIRFQQYGRGDFDSSSYVDGLFIDNVVVREAPTLTYHSLPFSDDFETQSLGSSWTWAYPDDTGGDGNVRPGGQVGILTNQQNLFNAGRSGTRALALGRLRDGNWTTNAADLHLNLAGETDVELSFWVRDFYDESNAFDGIFFSDDGGETFIRVFSFEPSLWADDTWGQFPPFDVDELATQYGLNLTGQFVIRFQQHGNGDFDFDGWEDGLLIDDVVVRRSVPRTYASLPFSDGFESGSLGTSWEWAWPTQTADASFILPGGFVEVISQVGDVTQPVNAGVYAVAMGRRNDSRSSATALDLHLDLAGETEVELSLWLQDYFDDTNVLDAIFFSDDGGASFTRVFALDPSRLSQNWQRLPPIDVDAAARAYGLSLSSRFVIRIQQYGSSDFFSAGNEDGFLIDDVTVTRTNSSIGVWPGDTNDDGIVNQVDVLPIGLYFGRRGTERIRSSAQWSEQPVIPWTPLLGTYADASGNGVVDQGDLVPLGLNWGRTRTSGSLLLAAPLPESPTGFVTLEPVEDGGQIQFRLVGHDFEDVVGVAIDVHLDPAILQPESFEAGEGLGDRPITYSNIDPATGRSAFGGSLSSLESIVGSTPHLATLRTTPPAQGLSLKEIATHVTVHSVHASLSDGSIVRLPTRTAPPGAEPSTVGTSTLHPPYPNPFLDHATITYDLAERGPIRLVVYNVLGQRVRTLVNDTLPAGSHDLTWNGRSDDGSSLGAGLYFLRLSAAGGQWVQKLVLVR